MKNKIIIVLMAAVIVIVGIFAYKQSQENKRYEEYLSLQLFNDYSEMAYSILRNQVYYEEILKTGSITADQMKYLHDNNHAIGMITQDYQHFAINLKRMNRNEVHNLVAFNSSSMGNYFHRLASHYAEELGVYNEGTNDLLPVDLLPDESFELEDDMLDNIKLLREFNQEWVTVLENNMDGVSEKLKLNYEVYSDSYLEETIEKDFWIKVNYQLEKSTENFLRKQNIVNDIGTLLNGPL